MSFGKGRSGQKAKGKANKCEGVDHSTDSQADPQLPCGLLQLYLKPAGAVPSGDPRLLPAKSITLLAEISSQFYLPRDTI
jgi:hypothetical protein